MTQSEARFVESWIPQPAVLFGEPPSQMRPKAT
jgi:hypothetical protein